MTLAALQRDFLAALDGENGTRIFANIRVTPDAAARFGVYRNAARIIHRDALRAACPVVEQLVGRAFFNEAADRYAEAHPSISGDLHDFGEHFAKFLREYSHAKELPYLPDMARLEWALHRAFHARDAEKLDVARLVALTAEQRERLCFTTAPGAALIGSAWPLLTLWRAHQPGATLPEDFDLNQGGECVVVYREGFDCVARTLEPPARAVLADALAGEPFAGALEAPVFAGSENPGALLQEALAFLVNAGILTDFSLAD